MHLFGIICDLFLPFCLLWLVLYALDSIETGVEEHYFVDQSIAQSEAGKLDDTI